MKQIQKKTSLQDALLRFRSELSGSNLTANQRINLMEEFKYWFDRTGDFDLTFNRISDKIMPDMERVKNIPAPDFKTYWKTTNNHQFRKLFGFKTEESKIREGIDDGFKSGMRETDVINALLVNAMEYFKRPLEQKEIDKIRFLVISEKVRLTDKGVKIYG